MNPWLRHNAEEVKSNSIALGGGGGVAMVKG